MFKRCLQQNKKDQNLLSYCTPELAQLGSAGLAGRGPTVLVGNGWVLMDSKMFNKCYQKDKKDQSLLSYCTAEIALLGSAGQRWAGRGLAGRGLKVPVGKEWVQIDSKMFK